jgi:5-methylcytosine-specific restriction endonuclease McrA
MSFKKGNQLNKGRNPWNKGIKIDKEKYPFIGHTQKHSTDAKTKISKGHTGKPLSQSHIEKLKGNKNAWIDGRSQLPGYKQFQNERRRAIKSKAIGSHTIGEWENLKAQYNWTCPCCGKSDPNVKLTEDHIIPLSKGGSDNIENIQPLCGSCNSRKHTKIAKYEL